MMETTIRRWQEQLRAIKHFTEAKMKRRIEVDGVLFSWLIPYVIEIISKLRIGPDGRTAYEQITEHKCRHFAIAFGKVSDFTPRDGQVQQTQGRQQGR